MGTTNVKTTIPNQSKSHDPYLHSIELILINPFVFLHQLYDIKAVAHRPMPVKRPHWPQFSSRHHRRRKHRNQLQMCRRIWQQLRKANRYRLGRPAKNNSNGWKLKMRSATWTRWNTNSAISRRFTTIFWTSWKSSNRRALIRRASFNVFPTCSRWVFARRRRQLLLHVTCAGCMRN